MTKIATETIEPLWETVLHSADEEGNLILTKNDVPVAELHLFQKEGKMLRRPHGLAKGEIWISDDFDDPMPDIEALFEGEGDVSEPSS